MDMKNATSKPAVETPEQSKRVPTMQEQIEMAAWLKLQRLPNRSVKEILRSPDSLTPAQRQYLQAWIARFA